MPPTVEDRLQDILKAIDDIEKLLQGVDIEEFKGDRILRLAIERLHEIACEATRKLPEGVKEGGPHIEWRKIIDFGNLLSHAYHATDVERVWDIIRNHLPPLKSFVEHHIEASKR